VTGDPVSLVRYLRRAVACSAEAMICHVPRRHIQVSVHGFRPATRRSSASGSYWGFLRSDVRFERLIADTGAGLAR
jgi:hypothetical protein